MERGIYPSHMPHICKWNSSSCVGGIPNEANQLCDVAKTGRVGNGAVVCFWK